MKINEILSEAIEPKRDHYHKVLTDNKEQLQKSKTRVGVIRNLQRMFPGIKFKMMGGGSTVAQYDQEAKEITINNNDKLMTGRNVRRNWDKFVDDMTDLLTHETIHQDQAIARDHRMSKDLEDKATSVQRINAHQKFMNLTDLQYRYEKAGMKDEAEEIRIQVQKLRAKARRKGIRLQGSHQDYLRDRDEITAYAEMVANDLVKYHSGNRREAIKELQHGGETHSRIFNNYVKEFNKNDRAVQQMIKQAVRYIEMKTQ